jgi:hypothetical protein
MLKQNFIKAKALAYQILKLALTSLALATKATTIEMEI